MSALTKNALLDLKHMLSDDKFASILLTDEKEVGKYVNVKDNGSLVIGKTKYKIWNKICKGEVILSPNDVCVRLINVITGSGGTRNKQAFHDLHKDFMDALERNDYSYIISRIFIAYRLDYNNDLINNDGAQSDKIDDEYKSYLTADGVIVKDSFNNLKVFKFNMK